MNDIKFGGAGRLSGFKARGSMPTNLAKTAVTLGKKGSGRRNKKSLETVKKAMRRMMRMRMLVQLGIKKGVARRKAIAGKLLKIHKNT